ncbi:MAG: hypothetical protein ACKOTZ_07530 [Chloroflexota bacterium]
MDEQTADPVDAFLARIVGIGPDQARAMRLAWDLEPGAPRKIAWARATAALRDAGRDADLDALRDAVNAWAGDKAFDFVDLYGGGSTERTRQEARIAALPAVMDAGLVAIAGDLLDQDTRYLLQKPFRAGLTGEARRAPGRRPVRRRAGGGSGG